MMRTTIAILAFEFSFSGSGYCDQSQREGPPLTVQQFQAKMLENHRRVVRGDLSIESRRCGHGGCDSDGYSTTVYDVVFDGRKLRMEQLPKEAPTIESGLGSREVFCNDGKTAIYYTNATGVDDMHLMLNMFDVSVVPVTKAMQIPDPRLIGKAPVEFPNLIYYDSEYAINNDNMVDPSITIGETAGLKCQILSFSFVKGGNIKIWAAPACDYGVVRLEQEFTASANHRRIVVETELERHVKSNLWFPIRCHYVHSVDGRLDSEEYLKIAVKSLNAPLDENTFTLAGLNIPPGTLIQRIPDPEDRGQGDRLVWDGHSLTRTPLRGDVIAPRPRIPAWRRFLIINSFIFAVLAALLIWRALRRPEAG